MKKIINTQMFLLSLAFIISTQELVGFKDEHFVVVIASRNNSLWCDRNLNSVATQHYYNWHAIYINDASTDDTKKKVEQFREDHRLQEKIMLINNETRQGALSNIVKAVNMCNDWDRIIILDGDDWLSGPNVLRKLNEVYANKDVWMTYGSYEEYPGGARGGVARSMPVAVIETNSYRTYDWCTSHLRSFYAWLLKCINIEDLMLEDSFFPMAGDLAIMFPMLELSGKHCTYIPDILYIYNLQSEFNDHKIDGSLQGRMEHIIRARSSYQPLSAIPEKYLPRP